MKKILKRKGIIVLFLILVLATTGFFLLSNRGQEEPSLSANTIQLERKTLEQIISVKAPLEGIEKAEVSSPLNYEIIDIRVKEGDLVSKNQILAVLDGDQLQKEINAAQNQIELTKLQQEESLRQQQLEYDKLILQLKDLEEINIQKTELYENGMITKDELLNHEKSIEQLKKSIENYQAVENIIPYSSSEIKRLEILNQDLTQKKEDLKKVYIKSPIDGTVTRVNCTLGRYANDMEAAKSMFVIENLSMLQMKVAISEFDIGKIEIGQEALIYSDLMGDEFAKGIVSRISPTAEQKDNNNMDRVIPVLIEVNEQPDTLIAGVICNAKIKVAQAENVFSVPSGALIQDENSNYKIFAINPDNSLKSIPVEIGLETELETELISSDLKDGMKIVLNPDDSFSDGMIVQSSEDEINQ